MSWQLGDITLPTPQGFNREPVFISQDVNTLAGSTKRDVIRRKYKFTLIFRKLTQAEASSILSEYNKNVPIRFIVSESYQSIDTMVLMTISRREYNMPGGEYREDFNIILIEV
jgi:hypothetical protein